MQGDAILLSEFERINRLLERLASELYGFIQISGVGHEYRAEQICLDLLGRAFERGDFSESELEMNYLREKLLVEVWGSLEKHVEPVQDSVFERFYSLPQKVRAALFLRHRSGFSFIVIGRILSMSEAEVREYILLARERILGRPLSRIGWDF